ncbi:MAG: hypothetical protein QOF00_5852 [Pseudonocardiales bacterium]|nr:hypothetical protein [Pseudonocardiales bacterium]
MEAAWFPVVLLVVLLLVATALNTATWMSARNPCRPWFWRVSAGLLWAGVLSWVLMFASGSTVGEDGVLHDTAGGRRVHPDHRAGAVTGGGGPRRGWFPQLGPRGAVTNRAGRTYN